MRPDEMVLSLFFLGGGFWVLRPLVGAVAKRIAGDTKRVPTPHELATLRAELLDELHQVRQEVGDLGERLDFAERLLAKQREGARLAPPGS